MTVIAGCVVPHPPIIVPEVGGDALVEVHASRQAMADMATRIGRLRPETLVFISPHSRSSSEAMIVNGAARLAGSLSAFGAGEVGAEARNDLELAREIKTEAVSAGVYTIELAGDENIYQELDHGVLVPLYFINQTELDSALVSLSPSYLSFEDHYSLGLAVQTAAAKLGRTVVFVASGDLSHRLRPGAPAGYSPRGEEFDCQVLELLRGSRFRELMGLEDDLIEEAGECGLRSLIALGGVFSGMNTKAEVLSYEGPFGVGYCVAWVEPQKSVDEYHGAI